MILLILKPHRTLYLRRGIDERTQGIAGEGIVVAACIHVLELTRLVEASLRIDALKQEALDLIGCIQRITMLPMQLVRELLQQSADVGTVSRSGLVDDFSEDEHLTRAEDIRRSPVE